MSRQKRMVHRAPKEKDVIQLWKKEMRGPNGFSTPITLPQILEDENSEAKADKLRMAKSEETAKRFSFDRIMFLVFPEGDLQQTYYLFLPQQSLYCQLGWY